MSTNISILGFEFNCNMKLYKIAAAARHAGLTYQMVNLTFGVDNTTDAYKKNVHPYGCAPAIQTEDGYVGESAACLRAIARLEKNNSFLYGRTAFEASQIDMWLDYVTCEIDAHALYWIRKAFGHELPPSEVEQHLSSLEGALNGVETWLETRTFLVGERLSIADINLAFTLDIAFRYSPDPEALQKKYRNVFRHYNTVMNQPKTIETLQAHKLAIGLPKAEKKKEEPKKEAKKDEPKKEAKKEEKPKKDEAEDEDEEPQFEEDKKKPNPLDALPPSKFVLDAFKREYSNKDTRKEAAPWFFDNYDPEGFTCFWCKYNYNDELKKSFMTSNLVRGWFQRMEHVRKYAFGSVLIVGEESKHEVVGFWVFRGKGLPELVKEVEDTELYTWTEIPDVKKEQAKITDYLAWDGASFAATPVLEGRAFK